MSKTNRMIYQFKRTSAETPTRTSGSADVDPFAGTLANVPVVPGSVSGTFDETPSTTSRSFTDTDSGDGTGTLTGTGVSGTINYLTGAITLEADTAGEHVDDSTLSITYHSGAGQNNGGDANEEVALTLLTKDGSDYFSRIIHPNRIGDETGLFQVKIDTPTATPKVALFGRAEPNAPWFNVQEYDVDDMDSEDTAASVVAIFPEMRVGVIGPGSEAVVDIGAWLVE